MKLTVKKVYNYNVWREYKKTSIADVQEELKRRSQFVEACKHLLAFQRVWDYTQQFADDWEGDLAGLLLHHGFERGTLKRKKKE